MHSYRTNTEIIKYVSDKRYYLIWIVIFEISHTIYDISCSKEFLWGKKPRGLGAAWHGVTARNGQVWQQSVKLRVCYIEIHLIESFHSIHENWFPYILILIKTQYSRNLPLIILKLPCYTGTICHFVIWMRRGTL